jgi:hypothetical protein
VGIAVGSGEVPGGKAVARDDNDDDDVDIFMCHYFFIIFNTNVHMHT